jgi:hypothetical protein
MRKFFVLAFILVLLFAGFVNSEEFGYNYLEKDKGLNQIPSTSSSTSSSSSSGGGNTTQEIRNAVNDSVEYVFTANKSNWWGEVKSYLSGWFMNISTVLTFNETKLNETIDLEGNRAGFNKTYYADEDWINKNSSNGFEFNESKLATVFYDASLISVITGTEAGLLEDIQSYNNTGFNISEVSSDFELRVNFTDVDDFNVIVLRYRGQEEDVAHTANVQLWDYDSSSWESYGALPVGQVYHIIEFGVFDAEEHIEDGTVQLRVFQDEGAPPKTHLHEFDWVTISKGFGTPLGEEVDPYAIHRDGSIPLMANWNAGDYNITAQTFITNNSICNLTSCFTLQELNSTSGSIEGYAKNTTVEIQSLVNNSINLSRWAVDLVDNSSYVSTYNATYALYNDTTLLFSINTTENIQNLLNDTGIYSTYNATYASNLDTNCSDSSCAVLFYWVNVSLINSTKNIGELYNLTASIITNLTGNLINTTSNIQGLLNSTGIYDTYNATYDNVNEEWDGNKSSIAYLDKNNVGNFNISANLTVYGHGSFGTSTFYNVLYPLYIDEVYTGTAGGNGINVNYKVNPSSARTSDSFGIGGYCTLQDQTTNFNGGTIGGLQFGPYVLSEPQSAGSNKVTLIGIDTWGARHYFSNLTAKDVYGLRVTPFIEDFGGNATAGNAYGIYISDVTGAFNPVTFVDNDTHLLIARPTQARNNYQVVLLGSGAGSGIWFNSTTGPRISAINNTDLAFNASVANFQATVSAVTYIDRSTEYDKDTYGSALQYLNDVSSRTTASDIIGKVEYNHTADPEFLQYSYGYPCNCKMVEICNMVKGNVSALGSNVIEEKEQEVCYNEERCDTCTGIGRDIGGTISWLRQTNFELLTKINTLESRVTTLETSVTALQDENKLIKEELCKVNAEYIFCKV